MSVVGTLLTLVLFESALLELIEEVEHGLALLQSLHDSLVDFIVADAWKMGRRRRRVVLAG